MEEYIIYIKINRNERGSLEPNRMGIPEKYRSPHDKKGCWEHENGAGFTSLDRNYLETTGRIITHRIKITIPFNFYGSFESQKKRTPKRITYYRRN